MDEYQDEYQRMQMEIEEHARLTNKISKRLNAVVWNLRAIQHLQKQLHEDDPMHLPTSNLLKQYTGPALKEALRVKGKINAFEAFEAFETRGPCPFDCGD